MLIQESFEKSIQIGLERAQQKRMKNTTSSLDESLKKPKRFMLATEKAADREAVRATEKVVKAVEKAFKQLTKKKHRHFNLLHKIFLKNTFDRSNNLALIHCLSLFFMLIKIFINNLFVLIAIILIKMK